MPLSSYLYFDGQCEAAFKFYERCVGWQNRGDDTPRGLVGCGPRACRMAQQGPARTHGCERPGIDGFRRTSRPFPQTLGLLREHCGEGRSASFTRCQKVTMPIGETFWAARFGMLVDKFGTPWM